MFTFRRLARRLDALSRRLVRNVDRFQRDVGIEVAKRVVPATPVKKGIARGNWRAGINAQPQGAVTIADPSGSNAIAQISAVARSVRTGSTLFIVNRAPHIGALNRGSSTQAAAGFIQQSYLRLPLGAGFGLWHEREGPLSGISKTNRPPGRLDRAGRP